MNVAERLFYSLTKSKVSYYNQLSFSNIEKKIKNGSRIKKY